MSVASSTWALAVASGFSTLLGLIFYLVVLAVAFGIVRPRRPDAWGLVAGWGGASIALLLVYRLADFVIPMALSASGGVEQQIAARAVVSACTTLLRTAIDVLLVLAIVRLARGPEATPEAR